MRSEETVFLIVFGEILEKNEVFCLSRKSVSKAGNFCHLFFEVPNQNSICEPHKSEGKTSGIQTSGISGEIVPAGMDARASHPWVQQCVTSVVIAY